MFARGDGHVAFYRPMPFDDRLAGRSQHRAEHSSSADTREGPDVPTSIIRRDSTPGPDRTCMGDFHRRGLSLFRSGYFVASREAGVPLRLILILPLVFAGLAHAAEVTDSTGRVVQVPDPINVVLPAGPPAAVLLAAIAPDLMVGWPGPVSPDALALLSPKANHPRVPRLTGREDVTDRIKALKPDIILDYGDVSPRYFELAQSTQQKTGVPTLLYAGTLDGIPGVMREVGALLHREARAEIVASFAEALLGLPLPEGKHPTVLYARGADGLTVTAPDTQVTEVFTRLGWKVLAPEGQGTFRTATIETIRSLDPDILIFSDPAIRQALVHDDAWKSVRAVRDGHVHIAPSSPFGWIEEPPSINRLLGLAWLSGHEPAVIAASFNAVVYGHALTPTQLDAVLGGVRSIRP
jgi:iron complex transport system substrate-binding protein